MQPHEERMIVEQRELREKVDALTNFLLSDKIDALDPVEQDLLRMQLVAMNDYLATLTTRVLRIKP